MAKFLKNIQDFLNLVCAGFCEFFSLVFCIATVMDSCIAKNRPHPKFLKNLIVIMILLIVVVLGSKISTDTVRKSMITMKIFEKFWAQTICCYTRVHDGCNAKNQTKKSQKASAH